MASGPASRASLPVVASGRPIGAQVLQRVAWMGRRADRIQRSTVVDGDVGGVSPALVDRFSQRVADRVQRNTRAHQVDSFAGGDNLDDQLDMPLVTNEGSITPLSDGASDETPFEFGSFSPENVQRKPIEPQAVAPAAPPMSESLRARAEQLRRSMAEGTPAPAVHPSQNTPAIQPSRAPIAAMPGTPVPRAGVKRAKPISRVEEIGKGSAPKPATPAAPPSQLAPQPPAVQRSVQTPSPNTPAVQRAIAPPNVVQGQGRLTQLLNTRFKPKLDQARNPDQAEHTEASMDFDAGITDAPSPRISRSAMPPADDTSSSISDDLTPRTPVRRTPSQDAGRTAASGAETVASPLPSAAPADVPVPTPKARILRKPASPAPAQNTSSAIQRKVEAPRVTDSGSPSALPAQAHAPQSPVSSPTPSIKPGESMPPVQRAAANETAPASEMAGSDNNAPAIQREARFDAAADDAMPLIAPASKAEPLMAGSSDAPSIQRETILSTSESHRDPMQRAIATEAKPAVEPIAATTNKQTGEDDRPAVRQDTHAPLTAPQPADIQRSEDMTLPPAELTLRTPSVAASPETPASEDATHTAAPSNTDGPANVQRSVAPPPLNAQAESAATTFDDLTLQTPRPATDAVERAPSDTVQRSTTQALISDEGETLTSQRALLTSKAMAVAATPAQDSPPALERMTVNAPTTTIAPAEDATDVSATMPLVQRAPAEKALHSDESPSSQTNADVASPPSTVPSTTPAVQRTTTPAANVLPSSPSVLPAGIAQTEAGEIQRDVTPKTPALRKDASVDLTLRAPVQQADEPAAQPAAEMPAIVQRAVDSGTPAIQPATSQSPAQRGASAPSIQRSSDDVQVLRAPAQPTPVTTVQPISPANAAAATEASIITAPALTWVQRTTKEGVNASSPSMAAVRKASVGMTDMPVLRMAARAVGDNAPEARTLSMPIVQRAAMKQEKQAMEEAQARPANPFVVEQARSNSMPVVQRKPAASTVPEVQRVETSEPAKVESKPAASSNRSISDAELTRAAQRILPLIKRMLALERERLFGR